MKNKVLFRLYRLMLLYHWQVMKDVEELRTLVASASRKRVQDLLAEELRKMELEVSFYKA